MLIGLGPNTKHLLNIVKLGEVSIPSRVFVLLAEMEIGLLGGDLCTT